MNYNDVLITRYNFDIKYKLNHQYPFAVERERERVKH